MVADIPTCPHCGSILVIPVEFSKTKQRIFDYIRKHPGCTIYNIIDSVWGGPCNPDSNALSVHLSQMKPKLRELGLRIVVTRGPGAGYRLVKEPFNVNLGV